MSKKIEHIKNVLINNEIQPSLQRIKIYEFLLGNKTHPTADTIYNNINKELAIISKATVYNTLKLFVEKNIISEITIDNTESRYDYNTEFHGHFKCEQCGELYDLTLQQGFLDSLNLDGYKINSSHLYIKGICKKCKNN